MYPFPDSAPAMLGKSPEATTYERIRHELRTHLRQADAPEEVRAFLLDQWARLMTGIFMAKGNRDPDWQAGWDTVNALLWTLSPKHGRGETMRMLSVLPTLLARLHEGCNALGYDARARDRLFSELAMLHAAIAREGLQLRADEALPKLPAAMRPGNPPQIQDLGGLRPKTQDSAEGPSSPPAESGPDALPPMRTGDWVNFDLPDGRKRMRLTWLSPQGGMYLFANDQGMDALSLTRARLLAKFESGEARLEERRRGGARKT